jgi:integrase
MTKKRQYGVGSIDSRGKSHRLRYCINGERFTQTFKGTATEARKELRRLLKSGDEGTHVGPDKITFSQWKDQWIAIGAPGRKRAKVGRRSLERYEQLLRVHVVPTLGERPLQQLQPGEIDTLYCGFEGKIAPMTARHVRSVLNACLGTAARKGLITSNPIARAEKIPTAGESDHGIALNEDGLRTVLDGFKESVLYPIVVVAALTAARRGEILALLWTDLDVANKTLRVERAFEQTKKHEIVLN